MQRSCAPEICSGTYFPRRGRPQHGYYVVLEELVLGGPFRRKRDAAEHLKVLLRKNIERMIAAPAPSKYLHPRVARTIESVLRKQEKALTAAMGAAS
jgi:N-dimethylarginine dimethylaminohydrolase